MPTKKENAELLKQKLGVEIDPEASDPKAAVLQGWADQVETDPDRVKTQILTTQLEDALDLEIGSASLAPDQLQAWLERAGEDAAAVRAEVTEALGQTPPPTQTPPSTRKVRVNDAIAAYDGTYADPEQPEGQRIIGAEAVEVQETRLITAGLRNGTLVEG